jgi:hypothetical protein
VSEFAVERGADVVDAHVTLDVHNIPCFGLKLFTRQEASVTIVTNPRVDKIRLDRLGNEIGA